MATSRSRHPHYIKDQNAPHDHTPQPFQTCSCTSKRERIGVERSSSRNPKNTHKRPTSTSFTYYAAAAAQVQQHSQFRDVVQAIEGAREQKPLALKSLQKRYE
eukprot:scpid17843/ scgid11926/ 